MHEWMVGHVGVCVELVEAARRLGRSWLNLVALISE